MHIEDIRKGMLIAIVRGELVEQHRVIVTEEGYEMAPPLEDRRYNGIPLQVVATSVPFAAVRVAQQAADLVQGLPHSFPLDLRTVIVTRVSRQYANAFGNARPKCSPDPEPPPAFRTGKGSVYMIDPEQFYKP